MPTEAAPKTQNPSITMAVTHSSVIFTVRPPGSDRATARNNPETTIGSASTSSPKSPFISMKEADSSVTTVVVVVVPSGLETDLLDAPLYAYG